MAKAVGQMNQDTEVLGRVQNARIERFTSRVTECEDLLKNVILYGDAANQFREVNEFVK